MFVSLFRVKVDEVSVNELSATLRLTDEEDNTITLFFKDLIEVRDFSRAIRSAVLDKSDEDWAKVERPMLITD